MGRLLKFVLFGALGLVAVLAVVAILAAMLIDPNDYRDNIAKAVKEGTGRDLTISGDLELGLFPWVSIDIGETTLGNREGFGEEPMLRFNSASIAVKLLPLFTGNVEFADIVIDGATVRLSVNKNGANNWSDMGEASAADRPADSPPTPDRADVEIEVGKGDLESFRIAGIAMTNSSVSYIDEQAETNFALSDFNFTTGTISGRQAVPLTMNFDYESTSEQVSGTVDMQGALMLDAVSGMSEITGLDVKGTMSGDNRSEVPINLSLGKAIIDGNKGTVAATDLAFEFAVPGADNRNVPLKLNANAVNVDEASETLNVEGLNGSLDAMKFSTSLSGSNIGTKPAFSGAFNVERFSARDLMDELGIEVPVTADPSVLTDVAINGNLNIKGETIALTGLKIKLDATTLQGTAGISGFESPRYAFDLTGDSIDADRYLEPVPEGDVDAQAVAEAFDASELEVQILKTLNAKGTLRFNEAIMNGLTFSDIVLGVNAANKKVRLNPLTAKFFGGAYSGDVRVDASGETPRLSVNEVVNAVQLGPLMKELYGRENVTGTLGGTFKLTGTGRTYGALRNTLAGDIQFALADGAIEGTDIWYQIRRARALLRQQEAPPAPENPRTEFSSISGTGKVTEGVMRNDDLAAVLPFLQISGAGTIDIAARMLDYGVTARVLERPEFIEGASAEELDEYTEAVIPIKITGPMSDPSIKPDIAGLAKARVQRKIDEKKDELKDKIFDRLGLGRKEPEPAAEGETETDAGETTTDAGETASDGAEPEQPAEEEPKDPEEELKEKARKKLESLFD